MQLSELELSEIKEVRTTRFSVEIILNSGVTVRLSSNPDYVHLSFSGIGSNHRIEPYERSANTLNIKYKAPMPDNIGPKIGHINL